MRVAITGATGFVGKALARALAADHQVTALVRSGAQDLPESVKQVVIGDLANLSLRLGSADKESKQFLINTDVMVHTAARVHIMKDHSVNPLLAFRNVNTDATLSLARSAANAGTKRFIFLSTIKVNGESTQEGVTFSEKDLCNPVDPYAISKWEAEQGLMKIARETGMEVVIIRPPLIYGPGVKGNFASMINLVDKGIPLPLGKVENRRSMLALDNLVDFIIYCLDHSKAANEIFLLSDGEDVSTPELIQNIAHAQGKHIHLLPLPVLWIRFLAGLLGKRDVAERLLGSLSVDISKAKNLLGWEPIVSMEQQLKNTIIDIH